MTEGIDEPYYCPICGQAWDTKKCRGCGYESSLVFLCEKCFEELEFILLNRLVGSPKCSSRPSYRLLGLTNLTGTDVECARCKNNVPLATLYDRNRLNEREKLWLENQKSET